MWTAEVKFSQIKLIWSAKYFLGRWDGGRWFWNTPKKTHKKDT